MTTARIMLLPPPEKDGLPQIFLEDDGIWRDMTVPQANFVTQSEIKTDLEQHLSNLMSLAGAMPPTPIPPENPGFRNKFRGRYDQLFPKELGDRLRDIANTADAAGAGSPRPELQIFMSPAVEWIPWELLHDGRGFLGLRFAVARLPILKESLEVGAPHDRRVSTVYSLLANNVLQGGAFADWLTTFDGFGGNGNWQQRFPSAPTDPYPSLGDLENARDSADIIHVTCHGGLQRGNNYYWTLDHLNRLAYDYDIDYEFARGTAMARRPLVFGNACASNATNFGAMHGFGSAFMIGGALNFVGTFAPITKTMAVAFGRRFYRQLLGAGGGAPGLPIAQALVATKKSFRDENCQDPSYLFYCLYGPSDTTYTPA
jgi:CHAT domain